MPPRGVKKGTKRARQYEHIKESTKERGASESRAEEIAGEAARRFGVVVALKSARTHVASPDGLSVHLDEGKIGLATAGSGDVLAGVIAGLLARGADPFAAAAWGVFLHREAGIRLARRLGPIGYLARELLQELPRALAES